MSDEDKKALQEAERRQREWENEVWKQAKEYGWKDLDGAPILEETHEIGYEFGEDGFSVEGVYIQPKKSIYAKD